MASVYDELREDIIKMQTWAAQDPTKHEELLKRLYAVRAELERLTVLKLATGQ
jgi:hypothetical protein